MSAQPYKLRKPRIGGKATIKGKLVPWDVMKRKAQRRPPFMTSQRARAINETLQAEARFGRIVPEGELTIEDLLAVGWSDEDDQPDEE